MSNYFTHLHVHTEFSLLDGAIRLDKLIRQAKEQELPSLAITDHGNIFGAVKFFDLCKKEGIKPVLGMEAYLTEDVQVKNANQKYYHAIILVQNEIGYKNLCKLISFSYQDGFYFKPRIDYTRLKQYQEGLIVTSACLGGHIPQLLKNDNVEEAKNRLDWFIDVFGKERFYLEVQPEDQDEQVVMNKKLFEFSKDLGLQTVATTDCHYLGLQDREAHEIMLALQTGKKFDDPTRFTFGECRPYMRNKEEMLTIFKDNPEAVYNTGKVADMCDFEFEKNKLFFPNFEIPQEKTEASYFQELCLAGLEKLIANERIDRSKKDEYLKRLHIEMDLIISMGFIGYFLIVGDFIRWARREGIPVGPGRGSAAGSLVAWCLEITNIDPIQYNLLFERFLNPERVTMPDIDIDFCIEGREDVINHIKEKYGHDKVCQIITFGTMMAKGVLKDVARTLGFSFEESNMITSLIPDQLKITLKEALEQEPRLQEMIDNNSKIKHLFDIAFKLEGLTRHASKHAAGLVVTPEPVHEMLPIYIPPKTTELVSQYAMSELESIGFLKIDLLGLKNLTLIKKTTQQIKKNHGISIDVDKLPLNDSKAFEVLQKGQTSGVFQLESSGIKEVLRKLKPEKFEDIIAVNALYRPGPLGSGMVDDFILRKHGKQKIEYLFPELEPILAETYGVIVYQEQVMKIASTIAGYSLGEADILRRAMGKKKVEVMQEQKKLFTSRAKAKGFNEKKAEELFDLMAYFAGYGFNKSHSAAYAMIAYQTAYLKANYTAEFCAALITLESHNAEKMAFYLKEAKELGLTILPPNVNSSEIDFSVNKGDIVFGLQGIKNVGHAALDNIVQERQKKPFANMLDFCCRIDLRTSNKRILENLIASGACDDFPGTRAQLFNELPIIMEQAHDIKKQRETGQMTLFAPKKDANNTPEYSFANSAAWSDKQTLEKEKEVLGFYLSSHPLTQYEVYEEWTGSQSITTLQDLLATTSNTGKEPFVKICALLESKKEIITKKGDNMAFLQVADKEHSCEIIVFPKTFKQCQQWLNEYSVFLIQGSLDLQSTQPKIKAQTIIPLDIFFEVITKFTSATLHLPTTIQEKEIIAVKNKIEKGKTNLYLRFSENEKTLQMNTQNKISISQELLQTLRKEYNITTSLTW